MQKTVFITGATSGFGEACAHVFASHNFNVIINGRREERLQTLRKALISKYSINCFIAAFDVQDRKAVFEVIGALPDEWKTIDVLINNAGLALGRDHIDEGNVDDWDTMLDTNVKGLLYVSKAIMPLMAKMNKGHIINLGSVAGKEVYEKGNVYCASKAAVDFISKSMRIDLLPHNIKVTAIHPGAAETEFSSVRFKGDKATAKKIYEGYKPLSAMDVADIIFYTASLPPHVCINDLVVTCTQQVNAIYFHKES